MRITNNMMVTNTVRNLNSNLERLSKAQQQISSENKISLPSDDPVVATKAITYRSYVAQTEQYQSNVESAQSWQDTTDDALSDLNDVVNSLRELVVQASSSTCTSSDLENIKTQVEALQESAVDVLNTSYAGRYIFAGYETSEEPYSVTSTSVGDKVLYKGDYLSIGSAMDASLSDSDITTFCQSNTAYDSTSADESIQYNIDFGSSVTVNVEGQDVTGSGLGSLFDTFSKVLLGLDGSTSYKTATVDSAGSVTVSETSFELTDLLDDIDSNLSTISTAQTELGARMDYVDTVSERLATQNTNYTTLKTENENIDLAEAYTEYTSAQSVYDAALSVGANVIQKTLVDYIA